MKRRKWNDEDGVTVMKMIRDRESCQVSVSVEFFVVYFSL